MYLERIREQFTSSSTDSTKVGIDRHRGVVINREGEREREREREG